MTVLDAEKNQHEIQLRGIDEHPGTKAAEEAVELLGDLKGKQ